MEAGVALLEDDHIGSKLEVLVYVLQQLNDDLGGVVAPLLGFLRVVVLDLEGLENNVVDLLFYR